MARIAGVNIPTAKRVVIALTYITGIGPATVPVAVVAHADQAFAHGGLRQLQPAEPFLVGAHRILEPDFDRIEAELPGDFIDDFLETVPVSKLNTDMTFCENIIQLC